MNWTTRFTAAALAVLLAAAAAADTAKTAYDYLLLDQVVEHGNAANHVRVFGTSANEGDYVTFVPSLGRGVEDYTEDYKSTLVTRLVEAGYRVVLVQPRGIGKSSGDLTPQNMSMSLLAHDLKNSFDQLGITKVNMIGHAFGNRLSRTFATLFPDYVDHLVLMASGGNFTMTKEQIGCLTSSINLKLEDAERLEAIGCAFFAKGNDPSVWLSGWYPKLAQAQILAATMISGDFFKKAGGKPFLLIQAAEDFIAPPDLAGRPLKKDLGDQVSYAEIPFASHALSSEQPEIIADLIVQYFARH